MVIDDALMLQLQAAIPSNYIVDIRKARELITANSGLFVSEASEPLIHSELGYPDQVWAIAATQNKDIDLGLTCDKITAKNKIIRGSSAVFLEGTRRKSFTDSKQLAANLLSNTFGVVFDNDTSLFRREYASAGGMYGVQVVVLLPVSDTRVWKVFLFQPNNSALQYVKDISEKDLSIYAGQTDITSFSGIDFILCYLISPVLAAVKYGSRGYRFSLFEVGAMYQVAGSIGEDLSMGNRVIGHFDERGFSVLLGLDPSIFFVEILQFFKVSRNAD